FWASASNAGCIRARADSVLGLSPPLHRIDPPIMWPSRTLSLRVAKARCLGRNIMDESVSNSAAENLDSYHITQPHMPTPKIRLHAGWAAVRGAKLVFHPHHTGSDQKGVCLTQWGAASGPYYEKAMMLRSLENTIYFASVNYALRFQEL